jgi:hypothetical protein
MWVRLATSRVVSRCTQTRGCHVGYFRVDSMPHDDRWTSPACTQVSSYEARILRAVSVARVMLPWIHARIACLTAPSIPKVVHAHCVMCHVGVGGHVGGIVRRIFCLDREYQNMQSQGGRLHLLMRGDCEVYGTTLRLTVQESLTLRCTRCTTPPTFFLWILSVVKCKSR